MGVCFWTVYRAESFRIAGVMLSLVHVRWIES